MFIEETLRYRMVKARDIPCSLLDLRHDLSWIKPRLLDASRHRESFAHSCAMVLMASVRFAVRLPLHGTLSESALKIRDRNMYARILMTDPMGDGSLTQERF